METMNETTDKIMKELEDNPCARASWSSAAGLRHYRGLTEAQIRKVQRAARAGEVERLEGGHCRTDYLYNCTDVLRVLGLSEFPKNHL